MSTSDNTGVRSARLAFVALAMALAGCQADDQAARRVTQLPVTATQGPRVATLIQSAQRGDVRAQYRLAMVYASESLQGAVDQKTTNAAEALRWMRAAAAQGDADGQNALADFYLAGLGVAQSNAEAVRWYRLAAAQGHTDAQVGLGRAFLNGSGVSQDYAQALTLFRQAVDKKSARGENELGMMYERGQGVVSDPVAATKLFRLAADQGNVTAMSNLASSYFNGRGVPVDYERAYFWYNIAAARLNGAQQVPVAASRDAVAKRLGVTELERAQTVARDWKIGAADLAEADLARVTTTTVAGAPAAVSAGGRRLLSSGSGFAISRAGYILTNAHVVNECGELHARLPGDKDNVVDLVAKDAVNDLAVLKLQTPLANVAAFRNETPVRQGDNVVVYGFPLGNTLAADGNLATGNISALSGLQNDSRHLQISAPVQAGNSGGPLVDMSGRVIGVVVSKLNTVAVTAATGDVPQNVNFAIKAAVARNFLDANGITYETSATSQPAAVSDVGERIRRVTLKIECWR